MVTDVETEVFLVDDDPAVRDALRLVLELEGFRVSAFPDGAAFLTAVRQRQPGCVVLDVHMPGRSGLEVLQELGPGFGAPVFMISGQGDIPMAVEAIKHGAHDFLEKPFEEARLLKAIDEAFEMQSSVASELDQKARLSASLAELTQRERQVMELVLAGRHNRDIATDLGISVRTVEVHKARMMSKLKADGVPQLVRMSLGLTDGE